MAFKKKATKTEEITSKNNARFEMSGNIVGVFEGEKYNFITVNVDSENLNPKTNKPYYNTFRIACPKSMELPIDEEPAIITGTFSSFFNRDKQCTEISLTADEISFAPF